MKLQSRSVARTTLVLPTLRGVAVRVAVPMGAARATFDARDANGRPVWAIASSLDASGESIHSVPVAGGGGAMQVPPEARALRVVPTEGTEIVVCVTFE